MPPAALLLKTAGRDFVTMLRALLGHDGKARAEFDRTHRVDAHQRVGDIGLKLVEYRLTEAGRHARGHHVDPRTNGVALLAQRIHIGLEFGNRDGSGAEKRIVIDGGQIQRIEHQRTELAQIAADLDTEPLTQILARDGARRHAHRRLAGR